jgi:hypothetical protein
MIGLITFDAKHAGERSAGKPPAPFDVAGAGNEARAAGLRASVKALEHPPEPKVGAPVLDPTCVQQRLACSAGDSPVGVEVRSPVAWIAGRRETDYLKPIDRPSLREGASHRAVTQVNADVASKFFIPKAEPPFFGRKQHEQPKSDRRGCPTSAG